MNTAQNYTNIPARRAYDMMPAVIANICVDERQRRHELALYDAYERVLRNVEMNEPTSVDASAAPPSKKARQHDDNGGNSAPSPRWTAFVIQVFHLSSMSSSSSSSSSTPIAARIVATLGRPLLPSAIDLFWFASVHDDGVN